MAINGCATNQSDSNDFLTSAKNTVSDVRSSIGNAVSGVFKPSSDAEVKLLAESETDSFAD
jgi:hypothetical protein